MSKFRVPEGANLRIGWDPLIGLRFPWAGDALTAILGVGVVLQAHHMRACPRYGCSCAWCSTSGIDLLLGVVPSSGDAIEIFCEVQHEKTSALLERHVQLRSRAAWRIGGNRRRLGIRATAVIAVIVGVAPIPIFVDIICCCRTPSGRVFHSFHRLAAVGHSSQTDSFAARPVPGRTGASVRPRAPPRSATSLRSSSQCRRAFAAKLTGAPPLPPPPEAWQPDRRIRYST